MVIIALILTTVNFVSAKPTYKVVDANTLIKTKIVKTNKSYDQVKAEQKITSKRVNLSKIPAGSLVIEVNSPEELEALFKNNVDENGEFTEDGSSAPKTAAPSTGMITPMMTTNYYYVNWMNSHKKVIFNGALANINLITSYGVKDRYLDGTYVGPRTFTSATPMTSYTGFTLTTSYSNNPGFPKSNLSSTSIYSYTFGQLHAYIVVSGLGEWLTKDISGSDNIYNY